MLDYVRIYNFKLIPDRLFEAKGADYNLDYLKGRGGNLPELNADQVLYGLIDKESVIHGVLWLSYNILNDRIWINLFGVDKEYQDKNNIGTALKIFKENHLKEGVTKFSMSTTRDKAFEKYGFTKSETIHMEYEL